MCGYGDSCVFMHDRTDMKSGWQMEQEWDKEQAAKNKRMEDALSGFVDTAAAGAAGTAGGADAGAGASTFRMKKIAERQQAEKASGQNQQGALATSKRKKGAWEEVQ